MIGPHDRHAAISSEKAFVIEGAWNCVTRAFFLSGRTRKEVLSGLSFRVSPGGTVALVGPSGSRKSTVFSLFLGFYENNATSLSGDGRELGLILPQTCARKSPLSHRRWRVCRPVYANIALRRPDAPHASLMRQGLHTRLAELQFRAPGGSKPERDAA
ncbi:ATP-binding cassette domain-containing protein [Rhizobium aegyptiacum]|uniref:ATP-binding cassette domain-containing protein n=1 Tax=Rhizobium aegyptiacum TaxID=1764550 RepID=UPI0007E54BCC|nr:ATP-binding cassette domain-containing protein [Rhizobium aegyptiacum]